MKRVFNDHFGHYKFRKQPSNISGLCAFGFEANPNFAGHLRRIQDAYKAENWRVEFIVPRIVSDVDDRDVTFYIDNNEDAESWGSSVTNAGGNKHPVTVKTLDFVSWFEKEILPARPKVVVAKMDIEGSEYVVIPRLVEKELLCERALTVAGIEWHKQKYNPTNKRRGQLEREVAAQKCTNKTRMSMFDDESFLHDGVPLPGHVGYEFRMPRNFVDININISKALYKAAHLDYLKRSGISEGTQRQAKFDEDQ